MATNNIHKNLLDTSQIRIDSITRISKDLIIKEIDVLNESAFEKTLQILNSMF